MLRASSVRPAPMSPAMPTISPLLTSRLASRMTTRELSLGWVTVQSRTSKSSSPIEGSWSGNRCSRSRPTMPRMIRSSSTVPTLTSRVSMVRPSRRIVIASATRAISFSLWLIMIEVMPLPCRPLSRSRRWVESSSLSAAVGSSRISSLHLLAERLGDLDQLLLADAEVLHRGERVLPQADAGHQLDGPVVGLVPVHDAARGRLVAEEDVLGDGELGDQRQLLVDDHDARGLALPEVLERDRLAFEEDARLRSSRAGARR